MSTAKETARLRIQARERLYQVVTSYDGRLRTVHDQNSTYPFGFVAGREQLAEEVVATLPDLPQRIRQPAADAT